LSCVWFDFYGDDVKVEEIDAEQITTISAFNHYICYMLISNIHISTPI